jgi:superfamily I DNA/RNA helicase
MQTGFLDLLVLDEAQDLFHKPYLDIFALLLKGGLTKGRWRIFGDFEHQNIYHHGSNPMKKPGEKKSKKEWFYNDIIDEKCALKTLSDNCRNTQEISAAIQLHAQLKPGYSRVLRGDSRHDPEIVFYNTNEDQITSVLKLIDCYLAEGFKASEIILLSPFKEGCLARNLCCDVKWRSQLKEFALDPITLTFSTIHAFKGLESSVVILTDINRLASYEDRDLLYVGMSRALNRLAILCHGSTKDEILKSCFL